MGRTMCSINVLISRDNHKKIFSMHDCHDCCVSLNSFVVSE